MNFYRPTYLKINRSAIKRNIEKIRKKYSEYQYFFAVVKADGYGHSVSFVVPEVIEAGCNYLAVSSLEEGIEVRNLHSEIPILCLEPIAKESLTLAYQNKITLTIDHVEQIEEALNLQLPFLVHIKIDTGMNRLGFKDATKIEEAIQKIEESSLRLEGIYTHIYDPQNRDKTERQIAKFQDLTKAIDLKKIPIVHLFASEAMERYPKPEYVNGCRLGKIMYGFSIDLAFSLESTYQLISHIIEIKTIEQGETVGYDGIFKADQTMKIAVLPIGYADGLVRHNTGREVYIHEKRYPIVGNICMDMCFVKVDDNVSVGDPVYFYKDKEHIKEVARYLDSIPLELLCGTGKRVPRIEEK